MKQRIHSGFTVIEVMIAVFILVVLSGLIVAFATYFFQTYSFSFEENQSIAIAQQSLSQIARDIREARSGEDGAYALVDLSDTSITFYSDVTNDGRSDRIRYFIQNNQLKRGVIEPTQAPVSYPAGNEKVKVILDSVDLNNKPLFTYYNGNWPSDTSNNPLSIANRLLNTRYISIYIRVNIEANKNAQPFELTTGIQIRSLKDNL